MNNPFRRPFAVKRVTGGSYINGDWIEGTSEEIIISASVQPVGMREKESLDFGERIGALRKVYSDKELYPVEQEGLNSNIRDYLLYDGFEWEIIACSPNQSGIIPHYKSYAVRMVGN